MQPAGIAEADPVAGRRRIRIEILGDAMLLDFGAGAEPKANRRRERYQGLVEQS